MIRDKIDRQLNANLLFLIRLVNRVKKGEKQQGTELKAWGTVVGGRKL